MYTESMTGNISVEWSAVYKCDDNVYLSERLVVLFEDLKEMFKSNVVHSYFSPYLLTNLTEYTLLCRQILELEPLRNCNAIT